MPIEETQIIWEKEHREDVTGFTAEQEHEFYVNLQAGNEAANRSLSAHWIDCGGKRPRPIN